jgi:hypothetical protein
MEQTQPGGALTNGLLTVELISGKRQFGDNTFTQFPPSNQVVVGDPTGTWPPYSALNDSVFPNKVAQNKSPVATVYQPGGTLSTNAEQAAFPGAAFGSYETDPGGRYGHNVPLAFSAFLQKVPGGWQTAMGYPITEPFWVNVPVNGNLTWVMVQAYERRVLSYTPTNPQGFQVEMGNIGRHYYQWRYVTDPGGVEGPPTPTVASASTSSGACVTPVPPAPTVIRTGTVRIAIPTSSGSGVATCVPAPVCSATAVPDTTTPTGTVIGTATFTPTPTVCATATPDTTATAFATAGTEIRNFRATVTDTTFSITFSTNYPATSYIRYGLNPGSYTAAVDIATTQTTSHALTLTGLTPSTYYYFIIRVDSSVDGFVKPEDYFLTTCNTSACSDSGVATSAPTASTAPLASAPPRSSTSAPPGGIPPATQTAIAQLTATAQAAATQTAAALPPGAPTPTPTQPARGVPPVIPPATQTAIAVACATTKVQSPAAQTATAGAGLKCP